MGLDFGFARIPKQLWISFDQDREEFDNYFADENHRDEIVYLNSWCGWGNPIEKWFRYGLGLLFNNDNGFIMKSIDPEDLYKVIQEGYNWYNNYIDPKPIVMGRAFNEDDDENLSLFKVDGIEVLDEDQAYHRFYAGETDGKLFMTKEWIDTWDVSKFPTFVNEIMDLLLNFDWDNEVLLYYISY